MQYIGNLDDQTTRMWWLIIVLAQASPPQIHEHAERIRAAMETSIAKQRVSVQKQAKTAKETPALPAACEPLDPPELTRMIESTAREQDVDSNLIREVTRQESGFHPCAVSPKGAEGLMQLMPATRISLDVRNPFDAQESLTAGAKLLKQLLDRYRGDLSLALSAYNAGPTRVDQAAGIPEIPETQDYVANILGRLETR